MKDKQIEPQAHRTLDLVEKHIDSELVLHALNLAMELELRLERIDQRGRELFSLLLKLTTLAVEQKCDLGELEPKLKHTLGMFYPKKPKENDNEEVQS